jgi:hypothetical protein
MIPNIAVDNIVEKHIQALALSGDRDWMAGGIKVEELYNQKQSVIFFFSFKLRFLLTMYFRTWRNGAREREKSSAAHRTRRFSFIPSVIDLTAIHNESQVNEDNSDLEGFQEVIDEDELIPRPVRRRRPRRLHLA